MSGRLLPAQLRRIEDDLAVLVKPPIPVIRALLEEVLTSRATIERLAKQQLALASAAEYAAKVLDSAVKEASR